MRNIKTCVSGFNNRMNSETNQATIGLLLSGGLDSCVLLGHLLANGRRVQPFFIRSRLVWESGELAAIVRYLEAMAQPNLAELVILELPVDDLYEQHWSITGNDSPDALSSDEAVFLPGRNALLLIKACIWCSLHGIRELTMAPLATSPFADASADFFNSFQRTFSYFGLPLVQILLPFQSLNKQQVMELGERLPLELSFSCLAPLEGLHCGRCNKCAERQTAFRMVGRVDRTTYACQIE